MCVTNMPSDDSHKLSSNQTLDQLLSSLTTTSASYLRRILRFVVRQHVPNFHSPLLAPHFSLALNLHNCREAPPTLEQLPLDLTAKESFSLLISKTQLNSLTFLPVVMSLSCSHLRRLDELTLLGELDPPDEEALCDFDFVPVDGDEEL